MRLEQILRGRSVIQFFCMIAIAVTTIFHVDASFASPRMDSSASIAAQDDGLANDGQGNDGKIASDLCNFCAGTAALADVLMPFSGEPILQPLASGRVPSLVAFEPSTTALPPRF